VIHFHLEELPRVTARAQARGQTPACFIRETALGAIPKAHQYAATGAALYQLARIGKHLDELTRLSQAGQHSALTERLAAIVAGIGRASGTSCRVPCGPGEP
jgi:hypothetical protein